MHSVPFEVQNLQNLVWQICNHFILGCKRQILVTFKIVLNRIPNWVTAPF